MIRVRSATLAAAVLAAMLPATAGSAQDLGFRAPEGFEVSLYAGDDLAHDIFTLTIDSHGRVVVASSGYIKTLHDRDGDGAADDATVLSTQPQRGARGMYFDGEDLICSGDDGLFRLIDDDRDGVADRQVRLALTDKTGDHAANGIVKGPDGWLYWICGNDAGIVAEHASLPGSPVKEPSCGALVRVSLEGAGSEVLAHGFRNPYDLDFGALGQVFTYDADGERDQYLPWYSPTRIFDIATGMHHGWVLKNWIHAWNRPAYIPDSVERLWEVGRGSPTGVVVCRHSAWPRRYQGGLLAMCWSFGRIYFFPLARRGSTWMTEVEVFMETSGEVGFAPVDMAIAPGGDLFVAIGGRGTRGSVFRVRPPRRDGAPRRRRDGAIDRAIDDVLTADQPLASWSRARWVPRARAAGRAAFEAGARDTERPLPERVRAVEVLVEVFGGIDTALARDLARSADPELVQRIVWAVSRGAGGDSDEARAFLCDVTRSSDARVLRAAWEALAGLESPLEESSRPEWLASFAHLDRRVRAAAVVAARGPCRAAFEAAIGSSAELESPWHVLGALAVRLPPGDASPGENEVYVGECLRAFSSGDAAAQVDAVRLVQRALGDVKLVQDQADVSDGFLAGRPGVVPEAARGRVLASVLGAFPSGHAPLDREIARLAAMLEIDSPEALDRASLLWTETSVVEDDIHYLLVASRIGGERSEPFTRRAAAALTGLHAKMRADRKEPSRFWPARVGAAFERLVERDAALVDALIADGAFGDAEHCLFIEALPAARRAEATRAMLARAAVEGDRFRWTTALVRLAGALPDGEGLPVLREQWGDATLRDPIALELARAANAADSALLVEALASRQANVVRRVASALGEAVASAGPEELLAVLEALSSWCALKDETATRLALVELLSRWTGRPATAEDSADARTAHAPWFEWFAEAHPGLADALPQEGTVELGAWLEALEEIEWTSGDATRGEAVFAERSCRSCHGGAQRLGPDLKGVAARLSRRDLFASIVDPSRDISPSYVSKEVVTRSGVVHRGTMIYESPAATLVQTGADTTVRLTGDEIVEVRPSAVSIMPEGLLVDVDSQGLADLYAYLRTLR